jgi:hypothetical protein
MFVHLCLHSRINKVSYINVGFVLLSRSLEVNRRKDGTGASSNIKGVILKGLAEHLSYHHIVDFRVEKVRLKGVNAYIVKRLISCFLCLQRKSASLGSSVCLCLSTVVKSIC